MHEMWSEVPHLCSFMHEMWSEVPHFSTLAADIELYSSPCLQSAEVLVPFDRPANDLDHLVRCACTDRHCPGVYVYMYVCMYVCMYVWMYV